MYANDFVAKISLNTMERVKEFVDIVDKITCDVYVNDEQTTVDAKSIMGIFSLNLNSPLDFRIEDVHQVTQSSMSKLSKFIL
jgi:phosphotransferase system HPr-like phosphotransfer protein